MEDCSVQHVPVLAQALTETIKIPVNGVMVDATVGQGGHSFFLGKTLGTDATLLGLDVDRKCLQAAKQKLKALACRVVLVHENFANLASLAKKQGIEKADLILADLGVSSGQLCDIERGLSFQADMPLDMRLDDRLETTAADLVNNLDEKAMADTIYRFGQDRASRRIARFIVQARKGQPITTTARLASVVCRALGRPAKARKSKIHPATRTFQALRIAVNSELDNLEKLLAAAPELLNRKGYIAIISFHSMEDRLVKVNFRKNKDMGVYEILTKKPITPSHAEIAQNPRARSAKLRIAQKL